MEIFQAIMLGIIEGLTEFLPISSTGHLIVAQDMLGYKDTSKMFTVVIQMGAIAAVIWFYRNELIRIARGLVTGDKLARRFCSVWAISTIPAGIAGLLFDAKIEAYAVTLTVAIALIVGGLVILAIERYHKFKPAKADPQFANITNKQALLIGIYQALALIPGVSRSGATIMGGVLAGMDRLTATAYSFYLGIPILLTAGTYKLITGDLSTIEGGAPALIAGTVASFITALMVVGWLLKYVSHSNFRIFAYYRIVFGLILVVLVATGMLS